MIMMGNKKNRGGALAVIMKKMGQGENYDSLKNENAEKMEEVPNKDGAESDYSQGLDAAANKMMEALESKNVPQLKEALRSFIEMAMHNN